MSDEPIGAIARGRRRHVIVMATSALMAMPMLLPASTSMAAPIRIAIERTSGAKNALATSEAQLCHGGSEQAASVALVPDALIKSGGRERVEYHGEIDVRRGEKVGVAWNAQIVDDRGRVVLSKIATGKAEKRRGDLARTNFVAADLSDGFYALQLNAAISVDDEPTDMVTAQQYVEVRDGRWIELTDIEWRERSRARLTLSEAELAGGSP